MTLVERLRVRESTSAKYLVDPGPSDDDIHAVLAAAVAVPEHGAVRPWRFLVLREEGQRRLSTVFVDDLLRDQPDADAAAIAKRRAAPLRSPLLIVVAAEIRDDHPKAPPVEQVVSAGLAAYVIQACFADMGYGAVWVTGPPAYSDHVKDSLGLAPKDAIVGFIHVGTRGADAPPGPKRRPDPANHVRVWPGD
ncbi:nitroreductase family protein [Roseospira visakhapatnamensis]|uniref:Putative NAD(P)H nitroreductase n=1 Tax=Roseospira visakhapatnamensis TaxID=390880 RepID=A0A7W6W9J0_9PROT|nr:nitroreductase family protein [Roseospira visakhapatnamensis]MBB4265909.1 nitroreductase [Roseospira visakhapatnamensis]